MKTAYQSVEEARIETGAVAGNTVAKRIYAFLERNELRVLGFVLLAITVSSLLCSYHKQLWLDEIFTIIVSSQPDLHHFFAAMPAEGNPPLNTFLTRLVIKAFGISQISVRLVPLAGFLTALTGVYIFVRREAGRVFGIVAVLLAIFGPAWRYSYEARPYGLLLGTFMLALVGWQAATQISDSHLERSRVPALFCMALGILGCAFSHYIGLIEIGVPLIVGEALRTYVRRRVDWPLVLTGLCCLPSLLVIVPMMRRTGNLIISKSFILHGRLTLHKIYFYFKYAGKSWSLVMDNRIIVFAIVIALVTWAPFARKWSRPYISDAAGGVRTYVLWASFAASLLIPVTWLALFYGNGWYYCRYGIGAALGIVIWLCLILARRQIRSPELVAAIVIVVGAQYVARLAGELRPGPVDNGLGDIVSYLDLGGIELIKDHPSNLPVVISNAFHFPGIWWYASAAEKPRVVFLSSPDNATEINASGVRAEKLYFHAPILDFDSFISQTPHFLLEVDENSLGNPQLDSRKRLESDGFDVKMIDSKDHFTLFDVSRREPPSAP